MSTTEWLVRIGRDFEADVASLKKSHCKKKRHAAQELERFLDSRSGSYRCSERL